jgi:hypothetical protein
MQWHSGWQPEDISLAIWWMHSAQARTDTRRAMGQEARGEVLASTSEGAAGLGAARSSSARNTGTTHAPHPPAHVASMHDSLADSPPPRPARLTRPPPTPAHSAPNLKEAVAYLRAACGGGHASVAAAVRRPLDSEA